MKIALIPLDIIYANKHENLISAAERMRFVDEDTDIIVLPETFTTGFIKNPEKLRALAETNSGHTMDDVHRWASYFKAAVAGTFVARNDAGTEFYNRAFFVEPCGDETFYDKHHLFDHSGEADAYVAGKALPPSIRYMGWNIAIGVCYDLRFPAWLRNQNSRYDALLLPANWPEARRMAWDSLLRARAIENIAYVAGANRGGQDPYGTYPEDSSVILDYMGHVISTVNTHGIVHASLDKAALDKFRSEFRALEHQDEFTIHGI